jgi:hypothetical protein
VIPVVTILIGADDRAHARAALEGAAAHARGERVRYHLPVTKPATPPPGLEPSPADASAIGSGLWHLAGVVCILAMLAAQAQQPQLPSEPDAGQVPPAG